MARIPDRNDYLVRRQHNGRHYLYAFDAWTDDVGGLLESARGYETEADAVHAAQRHAVREDRGDAVVVRENADGSTTQIGNVGTASRHRGMQANSAEQYWVWSLGRDKKPLTNEGPWGPYDYQGARSYARISATKGTHDRAVSRGKDPSSESFEIVRVYRAGTGEHKYGVAQMIGAPMQANASYPERAPTGEHYWVKMFRTGAESEASVPRKEFKRLSAARQYAQDLIEQGRYDRVVLADENGNAIPMQANAEGAEAKQLFAAALKRVDSKSVRDWASSERNYPVWLQIAEKRIQRGRTDPGEFATEIAAEAIGLW